MHHKIRRDDNRIGQPKRFQRERCDDFVADALTSVAAARSPIIRTRLAMLHLPLFRPRAAIAQKVGPVARQDKKGHDGDE